MRPLALLLFMAFSALKFVAFIAIKGYRCICKILRAFGLIVCVLYFSGESGFGYKGLFSNPQEQVELSLRSLWSQSVTLRRIKTPFTIWSIEGIEFDQKALDHIEHKHPEVPIWYIRTTVREPELVIRLDGNWKYYRRLLDSDKYLCVVLYMKYGKGRVKTAYIVEKPR